MLLWLATITGVAVGIFWLLSSQVTAPLNGSDPTDTVRTSADVRARCQRYMDRDPYYHNGLHLVWDADPGKAKAARATQHGKGRPPVFHYIVANDGKAAWKADGTNGKEFVAGPLLLYSVLSTISVGEAHCTFIHIATESVPTDRFGRW